MEPVLPPELFQIIIDLFHADSETLCSLGLVDKRFLDITRVHLFHRVALLVSEEPWLENDRACRLLHVLRAQPRLSGLVKELVLHFGHGPQCLDVDEGIHPIVEILNTIPCVAQLVLMRCEWDELPAAFQTSLANVIASTHFVRLTLASTGNFGPALLNGSNLKELALYHCNFQLPGGIALLPHGDPSTLAPLTTTRSQQQGLHCLHIAGSGDMLHALLAHDQNPQTSLALSRLTDLMIRTREFDQAMHEACDSLIARCSSSLRTYRVVYLSPDPDEPPFPQDSSILALSMLPQLERFEFALTLGCNIRPQDLLPHHTLIQEFNAITRRDGASRLKRIIFAHNFGSSGSLRSDEVSCSILQHARRDIWALYNDALSHHAFSSLRELTVLFTLQSEDPAGTFDGWVEAQNHIQGAFSALSRQGVMVRVCIE